MLQRLSKANGVPMSKIVGELLEVAEPMLERAVVILEAAQRMKGQIPAALKESLAKAEAEAVEASTATMGSLDLFAAQLRDVAAGKGAEASPQAARRAPARPSTPVPSNHGGQVGKTARNRPRTASRKGGGRR